LEEELKRYTPFWRDKILGNIKRDKENEARLKDENWIVIRVWESEIKNDVDKCATLIEEYYRASLALMK
jgi:DNA mismatch endonuclease (patch repair protein)